jgi:hypothetical protein
MTHPAPDEAEAVAVPGLTVALAAFEARYHNRDRHAFPRARRHLRAGGPAGRLVVYRGGIGALSRGYGCSILHSPARRSDRAES